MRIKIRKYRENELDIKDAKVIHLIGRVKTWSWDEEMFEKMC